VIALRKTPEVGFLQSKYRLGSMARNTKFSGMTGSTLGSKAKFVDPTKPPAQGITEMPIAVC